MAYKQLYKSSTDKKLDGICAGIAVFLNVDPTVVRLVYVVLTLVSGIAPGVVAYLILMFIVPREGEKKNG